MPAQPRYPRYDLEASLEVARKIRDQGGGEATADAVATYLGYRTKNSGAFNTRIASARMFGLIEGSANEMRTSALALSILQPDYAETEVAARVEAFESVPLFRAFLKEYEGQPLPNELGMRNALITKFGVKDDQAALALSRLLDSAEQARLFDVAGARTKLVRPPRNRVLQGNGAVEHDAGASDKRHADAEDTTLQLPKVIEGALEEIPWNQAWDEDALRDWIDWFEGALRMHFKLPRRRPTSSS